jgi:hypothetical protein
MSFRLSNHVKEESARRAIPLEVREALLAHPEQVVPAHGGRKAYEPRTERASSSTATAARGARVLRHDG